MAHCGMCQESIVLSEDESKILNTFFRVLLDDAEGGYILFDAKPVCLEGFEKSYSINVNFPHNKRSVALREGVEVWKKIAPQSNKIIIHTYDKPDSSSQSYIHVLFINKPLFLATVQQNLSLFRYILGPKITPDNLLKELTTSTNTFSSVLQDNYTLAGIVLGYGTMNSINGGRMDTIDYICSTANDHPPYINSLTLLQQKDDVFLEQYLFSSTEEQEMHVNDLLNFQILNPSFGFKTLKEEHSVLTKNCILSSPMLSENKPLYIYGCWEDNPETKPLISKLEIAQKQIQHLLAAPNFLETVLKMTVGENVIMTKGNGGQLTITPSDREQINHVLAKAIWSEIQVHGSEYITAFLDGFAHPDQDPPKFSGLVFTNYKKILDQISQNTAQANKRFASLDSNASLNCIIPQRLYYRILKEGTGRLLNGEAEVTLNYIIMDPNNVCLTDTKIFRPYVTTNLDHTVSGFAIGINGMHVGETREIFIHPELAYGAYTSLDKAISLRAIVTLQDINSSEKGHYSTPRFHDFSSLLDPAFERKCSLNVRNYGKTKGILLAEHLRKSEIINLKAVQHHIMTLNRMAEPPTDLSKEKFALLNRLHWNIYFGNSSGTTSK
jgi:FKBP-type peptidyl-prolyl cis-trans isomerase